MANLHIEGSSTMSRHEFSVVAFVYNCNDEVIMRRSRYSILHEWAAHKLLYQLHILRSHTESVDLDWPQPFIMRVAYFLVGGFALLFY